MNERLKLGLAALGGVALTLVGGGIAATFHHMNRGPLGPLAEMDTNKDGVITKAEWLAGADTMFQQFDTNKDGKLVWSELPRGHHHGHHEGPGPGGDGPPPPPPATGAAQPAPAAPAAPTGNAI